MTADPHTLVGPYVLDALPHEERDAFESHLSTCGDCRAEAEELLATAGQLGQATAVVPSPDLRDRVLAQAAQTRQVPPGGHRLDIAPPRRSWPLALAAAAAIAVVVALGALVLQADHRADQAEQVATIVSSPDAQSVEMAAGDAGSMKLVVSQDHGGSVILADGMAEPPTGKAYALWFQVDGEMQPAGTFAPDADGQVRQTVDDVPVDVVGITIEDAAGADEPTLPIIASGTI
ncbi:anti-sigma factor [soil metagenome]